MRQLLLQQLTGLHILLNLSVFETSVPTLLKYSGCANKLKRGIQKKRTQIVAKQEGIIGQFFNYGQEGIIWKIYQLSALRSSFFVGAVGPYMCSLWFCRHQQKNKNKVICIEVEITTVLTNWINASFYMDRAYPTKRASDPSNFATRSPHRVVFSTSPSLTNIYTLSFRNSVSTKKNWKNSTVSHPVNTPLVWVKQTWVSSMTERIFTLCL